MRIKYFSILLALLLSACGFHLRGMIDIPVWLNNVSVIAQNDDNNELVSKLKSQLEGYKIHVNPDPANAAYWLMINRTTLEQQIISIGASTNPRQYQLIMTTQFSLITPKGKMVKPPRLVTVTRQFTVNNDRILGSNDEQAVLTSEMRQETVIQIINRLSRKN